MISNGNGDSANAQKGGAKIHAKRRSLVGGGGSRRPAARRRRALSTPSHAGQFNLEVCIGQREEHKRRDNEKGMATRSRGGRRNSTLPAMIPAVSAADQSPITRCHATSRARRRAVHRS